MKLKKEMSKNTIYKSLVHFHIFWEGMSDDESLKNISLEDLWPLKQKERFKREWNNLYYMHCKTDKILRKLAKKINNAAYHPTITEYLIYFINKE